MCDASFRWAESHVKSLLSIKHDKQTCKHHKSLLNYSFNRLCKDLLVWSSFHRSYCLYSPSLLLLLYQLGGSIQMTILASIVQRSIAQTINRLFVCSFSEQQVDNLVLMLVSIHQGNVQWILL